MSDLHGDLASLRIDRSASRGRSAALAWGVLAVVLLCGVVFALAYRRGNAAVEVADAPALLERASPAAAEGTPLLSASGYLVARRKAVVSAKIQGRLAELRVEEGSRVGEGEVLARLESFDAEAELARARAGVGRADAELAESRRQLRVARELARDLVLPQDSLEAAESRVRVMEAALAQARSEVVLSQSHLGNTVIRAPFSGVVVKKMAEVGESVAPIPPGVNLSTSSGAIVALADLDTIEVEADVSESNVARIGPAQPAQVTVEAFPERTYRGELRQVMPTADRTKATVQVKVTILDRDPALKPEMSAKVTFLEKAPPVAAGSAESAETPVVTVPRGAVFERQGRPFVYVIRNSRVKLVKVATGAARRERVVVRQGLAGNERVVIDPPATLGDGDAVRVKI